MIEQTITELLIDKHKVDEAIEDIKSSSKGKPVNYLIGQVLKLLPKNKKLISSFGKIKTISEYIAEVLRYGDV